MKRTTGTFGSEMPTDARPGDLAAEMDLLPEYCHYSDEGCDLAPACLQCPFPTCAKENPIGPAAVARSLRDAALFSLHSQMHLSPEKLARRFHLDLSSVYRILSNVKKQNGFSSAAVSSIMLFVISSSLFIPDIFDTLSDFINA
jgi:hypothetical protein